MLRLHGDCHMGNVLWLESGEQAGPHFVDFDDSRMGPGIQDLWMLLSGSRAEMQSQLTDILVGYEDFFDFDARQLHLIEALRTCVCCIIRRGWRNAGTIRRFRRRSRGLTVNVTGRIAYSNCASRLR
jgi:Ser/Thr protein kinase RdoA (MazF antagonist)